MLVAVCSNSNAHIHYRPSNLARHSTTWYLEDDRNPTGYAQVVEERDASENTLVTYVYGLDLVSQKRGKAIQFSAFRRGRCRLS